MYTSVAPSRSKQEQVNQHRTECIRSYRYFLSLVSLPTVEFLSVSGLKYTFSARPFSVLDEVDLDHSNSLCLLTVFLRWPR